MKIVVKMVFSNSFSNHSVKVSHAEAPNTGSVGTKSWVGPCCSGEV